jgi:hypothetical protein
VLWIDGCSGGSAYLLMLLLAAVLLSLVTSILLSKNPLRRVEECFKGVLVLYMS